MGATTGAYRAVNAAAAAPPVNAAPRAAAPPRAEIVASDNPEMDEMQRERMAKIASLEQNNPYASSGSSSGMEDNTHVVGAGASEPAA